MKSGPSQLGNFEVISRTIDPREGKTPPAGVHPLLQLTCRTRDALGYEVVGERYSVMKKQLLPGASYQSEPGVMMFMSDTVTMRAQWGGWRMFSGEGLAKVKYTNNGGEVAELGLSPNTPMALVLPYYPGEQGPVNCKRGAFMAGDTSVRVYPKILPAASAAACCCGGMPPIIQEISGTGTALLGAGGTLIHRILAPGETIMVGEQPPTASPPHPIGAPPSATGDLTTHVFDAPLPQPLPYRSLSTPTRLLTVSLPRVGRYRFGGRLHPLHRVRRAPGGQLHDVLLRRRRLLQHQAHRAGRDLPRVVLVREAREATRSEGGGWRWRRRRRRRRRRAAKQHDCAVSGWVGEWVGGLALGWVTD